jgi:hypothetical protein
MIPSDLRERERIMGTETEYALFGPSADPRETHQVGYLPMSVSPWVWKNLADWPIEKPVNGFLPNGARTYQEIERYAEYSTAESLSATATVRHEIEGEEYVFALAGLMTERRASLEPITLGGSDSLPHEVQPVTHAVKRTLAANGNTCGMHANFLGLRELHMIRHYGPVLSAHLATSIWAGAGGVYYSRSRQEHRLLAGAKLSDVWSDFSDETTRIKPLINTRDEPWADAGRWRRIHVTSMDGNMWPWPHWLKLNSISLVLRLVENRMTADDLILADSMAAVRTCALRGLTGPDGLDARLAGLEVELDNGETINPLNLQLRIIERCEKMAETHYVSDEEREALAAWRWVCEEMLRDALACQQHVEWIGKLALGCAWTERNAGSGRADDEVNLSVFENSWCSIDPSKSIGIRTRRRFAPQRDILERPMSPELDLTRAVARGEAVRWIIDKGVDDGNPAELVSTGVAWDGVALAGRVHRATNPYNPDPELWLRTLARGREAWHVPEPEA